MSVSTVRLREIADVLASLLRAPIKLETSIRHLREECDRIDAAADGGEPAVDTIPNLALGQLWHDVYLAGVSNGVSTQKSVDCAERAVSIATMALGDKLPRPTAT